MKAINLNKYQCLVLGSMALLFHSCFEWAESPFRVQFSAEDLSYLFYNQDQVVIYEEKDIIYTDSIWYLVNDKDTVVKGVETRFYTSPNMLGWHDKANAYTAVGYTENEGFRLWVSISREDNDGVLKKSFSVWSEYYYMQYSYSIEGDSTVIIPDTVTILGKTYTDVYKLPRDGHSPYKEVYFAKKKGIIYFEMQDGKNVKFIKSKNPME